MSEDSRLLKRLRSGDRDALRAIYQKYRDDLLRVAASLLGNGYAAEDCLHDVFVAFAGAARGLNVQRSLKSYLTSCIVNRARDQLRKISRHASRALEESDHPTALRDPAEGLTDGEESACIFEALAVLPYEQREVVILHLQGELTFKEIARLQEASINTVQSRYSYGIDKLRRLLGKGAES